MSLRLWSYEILASTLGSVETKDFIGGGERNSLQMACWSVIGGGLNNKIFSGVTVVGDNTVNWDVIGGGQNNIIDTAEHAAIAGGLNNTVTSGGQMAAIPGGDSLIAQSYAQFVAGRFNVPQGTSTPATIKADDDLVIVGNGTDNAHRSTAFEISNSGHSVAHHQLGNNGATVVGGTYQDNVVNAWADVPRATTNGPIVTNGNVGVDKVTRIGQGTYSVSLKTLNPDQSGMQLSEGAVMVTVQDDSTGTNCAFATATRISGGTFVIHIHNTSCTLEDQPFFFVVCGR